MPVGLIRGGATTADRPQAIKAVPVRHTGQLVSAVLIAAAVAALVWSVATNETLQWSIVGDNLFAPTVLEGLLVTLELTVLAMVIGIVLGILLAVMRLSANRVLRVVSAGYIWLFRGTPVLVQLILWYNLGLIFPVLGVGSLSVETNSLITPFAAALLGLALNEGAYMAEVVRAGILAVDSGQSEAAHALGLTRSQTLRGIVLPQAMRVIIPPTGNETITMLKTTALVAVIAANDLLTRVQAIYATNFAIIELLLVASFWYLVLTTVSTVGQYHLERRFARGSTAAAGPGAVIRLMTNLRPGRQTARAR